jgi:pyruvate kinase
MSSKAQIIATIGPSDNDAQVLKSMIESSMDIARINFAWFESDHNYRRIDLIRSVAEECGRVIPIIADLPGQRVQQAQGHSYDSAHPFSITPKDEEMLRFCVEKKVEYIAVSFVGSAEDVMRYREVLARLKGSQKIIAKIERKAAVEAIDAIIAASDAVMVARGDLGKEMPLEEIPFIQQSIIAKANAARKPVITATQMLFSMTENAEPTRAEVTDVEEAIRDGSDAVMLSEETASGKFPVESVAVMERILVAAEQHYPERTYNLL